MFHERGVVERLRQYPQLRDDVLLYQRQPLQLLHRERDPPSPARPASPRTAARPGRGTGQAPRLGAGRTGPGRRCP